MPSLHSPGIAAFLLTAGLAGVASPAFSQTASGSATYAATTDATSGPTDTRAERKADWKAHRAQTNAELGKLEKNGYNPSANDRYYPNDLQAAEKKANGQ